MIENTIDKDSALFFELLQVACGNKDSLSMIPSPEQWESMQLMAKKHALNGIAFAGLDRLPREQWPDRYFRLRWGGKVQKLVDRNKELNRRCEEVAHRFNYDGFWCCILKGQGNLYNYPEWLNDKRTPGDIDVWVWPNSETTENDVDSKYRNHPIRKVVDFCQKRKKADKVGYIHLDFNVWKTVEIEVHFRPTFLCSPLRNRRLQKFCLAQQSCVMRGDTKFPVPTNEFNAVYQLLHIYKHLFEEGIGLRQLLDYYFVVANITEKCVRERVMAVLKSLAADEFTAAVMYVLGNVFGMKKDMMLCAPDTRRGEHLLKEILIAGNFGRYDERNGDLDNEGHAGRYWRKTKRAFSLVAYYPHEAIWQPYFMVYHMIWRALRLWRFE